MISRVLLFLTLFSSLAAAGEWEWQHPKPQGNTLWSVAFANEWYGYAVGDFGTIMVTYDHGSTWQLQYEGVTDNLRDLAVLDSVTVWIAGDNGMILHTTNGGHSWFEQTSGTSAGLNRIFFVDAQNGWACGNTKTIIHTTNAGGTWTKQIVPMMPNNTSINAISFISTTEGWAVGSGGIVLHTTDGGTTWILQYTTGTTGLSIVFTSATTGFITGDNGSIFASTNGGGTWTTTASGTTYGLNDLCIASSTEFWIAGDNGTLLHSTNAGASWSNASLGTYASLNGISRGNSSLFAVGENGVLALKDGAAPWTFINSGDNRSVNWVTFADDRHGYAVGQYGLILRTTDGGMHWVEQPNGITLDSFYGACMSDSDHVWIAGDLGVLLHSSNGGSSWIQQSTFTTNTLLSITVVDGQHGWAVGDLGEYLTTTNGGLTWNRSASGTTTLLFGVEFKSLQQGWIVGDNGLILHTTNGGASWTPQTSPVEAALFFTNFIDLSNGFCAGSGGTILRTSDAGTTWTQMPTGTSTNLYVVDGASMSALRAVGDSGLVLLSTSGGSTWSTEFAKTGFDLFGLQVVNDTVTWIGGDNGTILRKITTGSPIIPSIQVTRPNGGEYFRAGAIENILWNSTGVDRVAVDVSSDGGFSWSTLTPDLPASAGQYSWTVPFSLTTTALIRVRDNINASVTDVCDAPFTIAERTLDVTASWNLASLPMIPSDSAATSVFPGSSSAVFTYSGSYLRAEYVHHGVGYWVKYDTATSLSAAGGDVLLDTIWLNSRWNLVGSLSLPIPAASAITDPPGLLTTGFYGFSALTGYQAADSLRPGRGYWIKSSGQGRLLITSSSSGLPSRPAFSPATDASCAIGLTDAAGHHATLYCTATGLPSWIRAQYELPPLPPGDLFDARFSTGYAAEGIPRGQTGLPIRIQGVTYPVQIVVTPMAEGTERVVIQTEDIAGVRRAGQSLILRNDAELRHLRIIRTESESPTRFSLQQAYPNPCNPSTHLAFSLATAARVEFGIYNLLGQRVRNLAADQLEAGTHVRDWDGTNDSGTDVSSGVYIARLIAFEDGHIVYQSATRLLLVR